PEREDYLLHITTGTHVAQICLFLLAESRVAPARLLQSSPPRRGSSQPGAYTIVDLDLSRYDRIAARFVRARRERLSSLEAGHAPKHGRFTRLLAHIGRAATASRAPLPPPGPPGAAKSQLARRIYALKRARQKVEGSLVEVNCATIRGDGAMS